MSPRDPLPQPASVRLIRPTVFFQGVLPKETSETIRPADLESEGLRPIAEGYYRKDFSGVLALTVRLETEKGHCYRWDIHLDRLLAVNAELATMKNRIESETARLVRVWKREHVKDRREKDSMPPSGSHMGTFMPELISASSTMGQQRAAFMQKYRDFMNLFTCTGQRSNLCRCSCFPIEACSTTQELGAYFEFARLYLDVFRGLEKSKTRRAISKQKAESAILMYYVAHAVIRKMRERYDETGEDKPIKRESPEVLKPLVDSVLFPGEESTRKWKFRASDLALDLVAPMCGTTPQNLRDLLRNSGPCAFFARDYVAGLKEPERLLSGTEPLPELLPMALTNYGKGSLRRMIRSFLIRP